ncbi:methionine ABC transporter ATP-binding protein [Proteiniborus sp.]|uniref:methionine ABC transporter ATP-binding protein n=1 Tax=Proteiniborus sp. TaxID=2079015 RepID=UPI0033234D3B
MIIANDIVKSYGDIPVLCGVDLHIEKGQIYGLVGRSGAGKSTLLRCINGLETYDQGSLIVDGVEIKNLNTTDVREFRKNIGMIFQHFSLLSRLNVYENIALPLKCWKYDTKKIDKKVKELLELVEIPEKIYQKPKELSGGQKQRVAIARALALNPKILLCDEATSALDPKTSKSITNLLTQLNKHLGITIIVVTHQMSVITNVCEEISILENGIVAANGMVEDIFLKQPKALKNLIGESDIILPGDGVNIRILLAQGTTGIPIITQMARQLGIDFSILGGDMESYRDKILGSVIINVSNENYKSVEDYLNSNNVNWELVDKRIYSFN